MKSQIISIFLTLLLTTNIKSLYTDYNISRTIKGEIVRAIVAVPNTEDGSGNLAYQTLHVDTNADAYTTDDDGKDFVVDFTGTGYTADFHPDYETMTGVFGHDLTFKFTKPHYENSLGSFIVDSNYPISRANSMFGTQNNILGYKLGLQNQTYNVYSYDQNRVTRVIYITVNNIGVSNLNNQQTGTRDENNPAPDIVSDSDDSDDDSDESDDGSNTDDDGSNTDDDSEQSHVSSINSLSSDEEQRLQNMGIDVGGDDVDSGDEGDDDSPSGNHLGIPRPNDLKKKSKLINRMLKGFKNELINVMDKFSIVRTSHNKFLKDPISKQVKSKNSNSKQDHHHDHHHNHHDKDKNSKLKLYV